MGNLPFEDHAFNPLKEAQADEASRFLDILDSPENSDDEGNNIRKDFSTPFAFGNDKEEVKNIASQICSIVRVDHLTSAVTKKEISTA